MSVVIRDIPGYISYECKQPVVLQVLFLFLELVLTACFFYLIPYATIHFTSSKPLPAFVMIVLIFAPLLTLALVVVLEIFRNSKMVVIDTHTGEAEIFRRGLFKPFLNKKINVKHVAEVTSKFVSQIASGQSEDKVFIYLKLKSGQFIELPQVKARKEAKWIALLIQKYFPTVTVNES